MGARLWLLNIIQIIVQCRVLPLIVEYSSIRNCHVNVDIHSLATDVAFPIEVHLHAEQVHQQLHFDPFLRTLHWLVICMTSLL